VMVCLKAGDDRGMIRGGSSSVSDPDQNPVGSAFNLSLDPGSGSVFGIRIRIPDPDV
jgi:hypothetical protein